MSYVSDVPSNRTTPLEATVPRKLQKYLYFANKERATLENNVFIYLNKLDQQKRSYVGNLLYRVIASAVFIPAHRNNFVPGEFKVENMKYFVVHRPGIFSPKCSLLSTIRTFAWKTGEVAASHFIVGYNGELIQMVDLGDLANHCGETTGKVFNKNSVGVELEGAIGDPITLAQYKTTAQLIRTLNGVSGFLPSLQSSTFIQDAREVLVGHSEISPGRKHDPGPNMNYSLLAAEIQNARDVTSPYRAPFDPRMDLESSIQNIVAQAQNPGSAAEIALLSSTTQTSLATMRAMMLRFSERSQMAQWASSMAQKSAAFIGRTLADQLKIAQALGHKPPKVSTKGIDTYINFKEGEYTKG